MSDMEEKQSFEGPDQTNGGFYAVNKISFEVNQAKFLDSLSQRGGKTNRHAYFADFLSFLRRSHRCRIQCVQPAGIDQEKYRVYESEILSI
jgi:hypothetical protein